MNWSAGWVSTVTSARWCAISSEAASTSISLGTGSISGLYAQSTTARPTPSTRHAAAILSRVGGCGRWLGCTPASPALAPWRGRLTGIGKPPRERRLLSPTLPPFCRGHGRRQPPGAHLPLPSRGKDCVLHPGVGESWSWMPPVRRTRYRGASVSAPPRCSDWPTSTCRRCRPSNR